MNYFWDIFTHSGPIIFGQEWYWSILFSIWCTIYCIITIAALTTSIDYLLFDKESAMEYFVYRCIMNLYPKYLGDFIFIILFCIPLILSFGIKAIVKCSTWLFSRELVK